VILVDSSVWIDHFRKPSSRLVELLNEENVFVHPLVIGEIACGNLKNRTEIIALLHALPLTKKVFFIEQHKLHGRGVGLIDVHLLASCLLDQIFLWTVDKRLEAIAKQLRVNISDSTS